jgi:metal-dependent hydrolase (beta-lactamase superfamily II)
MKKCIIENSQLSYILKVDGQKILFNGGSSADYFEDHYRSLGYLIKRIKTYNTHKDVL